MIRKFVFRRTGALLLTGIIAISVPLQTACDKKKALDYAQETSLILKEARPLLVQVGLPDTQISRAIEYTDKLVAYLEKPDSGTGSPSEMASNILKAVQAVIDQTNLIQDQGKKIFILACLGIANIALHHLLDEIVTSPDGAKVGLNREVAQFRTSPVWRCRSAQTGQWKKMEWCKAHPDISVAEVVR